MNISGPSSRSHPPPSPWPTSMMSWLLWPSSERCPTPLTMLYAPSQSWTSLTSSQSSNHSATWTRCVATSLEHRQHSLHCQPHKKGPKGCLKRPPLPLSHPHPPHHLPLRRIGAITINATSALALVTPQPTSNTAQSAQVATASALSSVIQSQSHSSWNADTGASAHMTFNLHWMRHMKPHHTPIHLADRSVLYSERNWVCEVHS